MKSDLYVLDAIALTEDIDEHGLRRGQVGTIVENLSPDVFEVEFADTDGRAYALIPVRAGQMMPLRYAPSAA